MNKVGSLRLSMAAVDNLAYRIGQGIAREIKNTSADKSTVIGPNGLARPIGLDQIIEDSLRGAALRIAEELYYEAFSGDVREKLRFSSLAFKNTVLESINAGYKDPT